MSAETVAVSARSERQSLERKGPPQHRARSNCWENSGAAGVNGVRLREDLVSDAAVFAPLPIRKLGEAHLGQRGHRQAVDHDDLGRGQQPVAGVVAQPGKITARDCLGARRVGRQSLGDPRHQERIRRAKLFRGERHASDGSEHRPAHDENTESAVRARRRRAARKKTSPASNRANY